MKQIFILDDHDIVTTGLQSFLSQKYPACQFAIAKDLIAAKALVRSNAQGFDLAVLDVEVPGGCIFEWIREHRKLQCLRKVFIVSGMLTDRNISLGLAAKVDALVAKIDGVEHIESALNACTSDTPEPYYSPSIQRRLTRPLCDFIAHPPKVRQSALTDREIAVLKCLGRGLSTKEVAQTLFISTKTVDRHRCNIMQKLRLHSQIALSHYAIREGLIHI